ncbi:hypothetical protein PG990_010675 [Apiospora arundinis]|uniref:AA1-like domain-containing protein n=1 Tax=Apiospora arundinis TaxID=335852 RepID=A0ABR2IW68_9PEZI
MVSKVLAFATGLLSLAGAAPLAPREGSDLYWPVTEFSAAKGHNTGYTSYSFKIAAPAPDSPVLTCTAYNDAGFSGASWLALVYDGKCKDASGNAVEAAKWKFSQSPANGTTAADAYFSFEYNDQAAFRYYTGTYVIPGSQVRVDLNQEPNPFDTDVYYVGPKEFRFTNFTIGI